MRAASDLLHDFQHVISEVRLITGSKGIFEVTVDGRTLYSKRERGRHANPGEVLQFNAYTKKHEYAPIGAMPRYNPYTKQRQLVGPNPPY